MSLLEVVRKMSVKENIDVAIEIKFTDLINTLYLLMSGPVVVVLIINPCVLKCEAIELFLLLHKFPEQQRTLGSALLEFRFPNAG